MSEYMQETERLIECLRCSMVEATWLEHRAALLAHIERGRVPEGWKLVPNFVTEEMQEAFYGNTEVTRVGSILNFSAGYSAMLAAAPAAPDHSGWSQPEVRALATPEEMQRVASGASSDLKMWMNPLLPESVRLQIADGEIERLREELAAKRPTIAEKVRCIHCGGENWIMDGKAPCQITEEDKAAAQKGGA